MLLDLHPGGVAVIPRCGGWIEFEWATFWEFEHEGAGPLPDVTHFGSEEAAVRWICIHKPSGTLREKRVSVTRHRDGFYSA